VDRGSDGHRRRHFCEDGLARSGARAPIRPAPSTSLGVPGARCRGVEKIEADAETLREQTGRPPLGAEAILRQHPKTEPNQTKKSPAPRFHAFSQRVRRELYEAYAFFVSAFRIAADKLKAGDRKASFLTGSFPPHLPFVRDLTAESLAPG
jgi:hypothetical protein